MRIQLTASLLLALTACVSNPPIGGPIGEGASDSPTIVSVDTSTYPPKSITVKLDKDAYAVLMLVAPGHSATMLYPRDSTTENRFSVGTHDIKFEVPGLLALSDSARLLRAREARARADSAARNRSPSQGPPPSAMMPINPNTSTYVLVVTSPQALVYKKVLDKTAGWSIPLDDMEALNAVAKQVKSTITGSSRDWSAAYHVIALTPPKK